jgi:RimJ/RimL family protein N-acetyltransferase
MIGLETERLTFRQWRNSDFPIVAQFYSIEENARYVGGVKTPEEAWRVMATYAGHYTLNGFSYLAIDEKDTGNLIGTVGLWKSDPWPEPELGYWLLPEFRGKGYGVEAGITVKQYALETLKLNSLVSYIHPANEPSKKLALRLGAVLDSTIELFDFGLHQVYRHK